MRSYKSALLPILVTILLFSSTFIIYWDIEPYYQLQPDSKGEGITELEDEASHVHSLSFSESSDEETCPYCDGTGQVITGRECEDKTCPNCGGAGEITTYVWKEGSCPACRGSGKILSGISKNGVLVYSTCYNCKGTKVCIRPFIETIPCPICNGAKVYTHCYTKYGPCPCCSENSGNDKTSTSGELMGMLYGKKGDVQIFCNGNWIIPKIGMNIFSNDVIITKSGSKAELYFHEGSVIRLDENTKVKVSIIEESLNKGKRVRKLLETWWGRLHLKLKRIEIRDEWRLRIPSGSSGVRGTEFILDVAEDGGTNITVLQGCVEVSDFEYSKIVLIEQNQTSTIEPGGLPSDPQDINLDLIDRWWEWEEDEEEEKGTPGFEAIAVIAAIAVALIILRRKK